MHLVQLEYPPWPLIFNIKDLAGASQTKAKKLINLPSNMQQFLIIYTATSTKSFKKLFLLFGFPNPWYNPTINNFF